MKLKESEPKDTVKVERQWKDRLRREYDAPHLWEEKWGEIYRAYVRFGTRNRNKSDQEQERYVKLPPIQHKDMVMFPSKKTSTNKSDHLFSYLAGKRASPMDMYYQPCSSAQEYGWESRSGFHTNQIQKDKPYPPLNSTARQILTKEEMIEYETYLKTLKPMNTLERFPNHTRGIRNPERFLT